MSDQQPNILFTPHETVQGLASFPYDVKVFANTGAPRDVFMLRCAAYRSEGLMGGSTHEFSDEADAHPQTVHVAAYHGNTCLCAARMTFKGWNEPASVLPCAPHYPALQSPGLRKLSIAEMSHLVIDPQITDAARRTVLFSSMVRGGLLAVQAARMAMLVCAARPDLMTFYTRMLRFHTIGTPARYPPAAVDLTLVGGNMIGAGRRAVERNAFFRTAPQEIASMRDALLRCLGTSPHTRVLTRSLDGPGA